MTLHVVNDNDARILRAMNAKLQGIRGDGVVNGPNGVSIRSRRFFKGPGDPSEGDVVTIVTIHADYMMCRPYGVPVEAGSKYDFPVAKPWDLRQTPFDGQTLPNKDGTLMSYAYDGADSQARTVTDTTDDSEEDQVIVPAYVPAQTTTETVVDDVTGEETEEETDHVGSQLTVEKLRNGAKPSITAEITNDEEEAEEGATVSMVVEYEDCNRAGRAWAEDNGS